MNIHFRCEKVELGNEYVRIAPLDMLINTNFDAFIPGLSLLGDYQYYKLQMDKAIVQDDVKFIREIVDGVVDIKILDSYTLLIGITKSKFFHTPDVMCDVMNVIRSIYDKSISDDNTQESVRNDIVKIAMQSTEEIRQEMEIVGLFNIDYVKLNTKVSVA